MFKIKICGITSLYDAMEAIKAGADALGFVFHSKSPRNITPENAASIIIELPPFIQTVGLFVNQPETFVNKTADLCKLEIVQLHGEETAEYCTKINRRIIKAFRVKDRSVLSEIANFKVAGYLLDAWSSSAHGGTGETFNWDLAAAAVQINQHIILAGGLKIDNVANAIKSVKPYAIDVSSGVESSPGKKDSQMMKLFIQNAREAYRDIS